MKLRFRLLPEPELRHLEQQRRECLGLHDGGPRHPSPKLWELLVRVLGRMAPGTRERSSAELLGHTIDEDAASDESAKMFEELRSALSYKKGWRKQSGSWGRLWRRWTLSKSPRGGKGVHQQELVSK